MSQNVGGVKKTPLHLGVFPTGLTTAHHRLLHVLRSWERREKQKGKLPGLKMSAQNHFDFPGRAYPLPKCPSAVLTSLGRLDQARKPLRSNQVLAPSPTALDLRHFRWCSSHFVSRQRIPRAGEVQFLLVTNSSVLPPRCGRPRRALTTDTASPPYSAATAVASARN